jgi:hypothetical protein
LKCAGLGRLPGDKALAPEIAELPVSCPVTNVFTHRQVEAVNVDGPGQDVEEEGELRGGEGGHPANSS